MYVCMFVWVRVCVSVWGLVDECGYPLTGQINNYCQNVKEFTSQNLGKLFMAEALQGNN